MKNRYCGNSGSKDAARTRLYDAVVATIKTRRNGLADHVLIFAGYGCPELASARRLVNDSRILIVDRDPSCRADARRIAPGAQVFASVAEASAYLGRIGGSIAFANLDLMGAYFTDGTRGIFATVARHMRRGGVVSCTYLRGREHKHDRGFRQILSDVGITFDGWRHRVERADKSIFRSRWCRRSMLATFGEGGEDVIAFDYIGAKGSPMGVCAIRLA